MTRVIEMHNKAMKRKSATTPYLGIIISVLSVRAPSRACTGQMNSIPKNKTARRTQIYTFQALHARHSAHPGHGPDVPAYDVRLNVEHVQHGAHGELVDSVLVLFLLLLSDLLLLPFDFGL